ncbi:MAG: UDP-N-acetylmuramate--L-alanine ligase [Actinomycetota bacterium]
MTYIPPPGSIPTLDVPDLEGIKRVHMIGIGGAGMSGIALLLLAAGIEVTGSDLKDSYGLGGLRAAGARIEVGHRADHLGDPDAVVVSSAIPETNPELAEARRRGLPVFARAQVLASLARGRRSFAVTGTHGKTTTTSMLAVILERAGLDPSYSIGGDLNESGSNARAGGGNVFVAEADESDGSFLLLAGDVGIVTNIEEDHLDFYRGGEAEIREAFATFMDRCVTVIAGGDDEGVRAAAALSTATPLLYGLGEYSDVRLTVRDPDGWDAEGTLDIGGQDVDLRLRVPGVHNLLNATAALLAAREAGVDPAEAAEALAAFSGVRRRFEYRGSGGGAEFFDDYAHHPTEIAATLAAAARRAGHERLLAVFQPHRYTRTQSMWRDLGESLAEADVVVVTDVYAAGEEPIPGVSGKLLVDALAGTGWPHRLVYLPRRRDVVRFLSDETRSGDLVLTLGAGDITVVADETLERIREEP